MIIDFNKQKNTLFLILFYLIAVVIALINLQDFGIHIEERFHRLNGHFWLNYIAKVFNFSDIQEITKIKINEISDYTLSPVSKYNKYGILLDLPVAALEILFKIEDVRDVYYLKHFLGFSIFLVSSLFFFKILQGRFDKFYLSFFGLILYMTTPRILGDSFLYKDVLFLSFLTITLHFFIKSINELSFRNLIFFSLFTALSFNLRIFSIIIPLLFIFFITIKNFYSKNLINDIKKIIFYLFFLIFFIFIFWPYLWSDPLNNFLNLFKSVKQDLINVKILYDNSYISNRTLPDTYIINWIIISSPALQTFLFFFGYLACFYRVSKRFIKIKKESIYNDLWRSKGEEIDFIFLIILSFFYIFFIFFNSPLYNGWRLVYFFNIFIIYFSVYSLFNFENFLKKKKIR